MTSTSNIATQIDNLEALLTAVKAQPEHLFNLNYWRQEEPCGTLFCVAGLAASMPKFQALGLNWSKHGDPTFNGISMWNRGGDVLFGDDSMNELFATSGQGHNDCGLGLDYEDDENDDPIMECTDKELAIARIEDRITTYKAKLENA